MNKKELIKLLDKYEIEYEITDNTKEVEEGLRLFDEALEKIGIVTPKEARVDTVTIDFLDNAPIAIPPVTPTERTGWIPVKKVYRTNDVDFPNTHIEWETATEPDDIDAVRCSKCGEVFDFEDARNWCTECGAKMI